MGHPSRRCAEFRIVLRTAPLRVKSIRRDRAILNVWTERTGPGCPHRTLVGLQRRLVEAATALGDLVLDPARVSFLRLEVVESCAGRRAFLGTDRLA